MTPTFTLEEIRSYILSQDSLGDALYNLSEDAIKIANHIPDTTSIAYKEGLEEYESGKRINKQPI